jgi:hypothetical protein
MQGTHTTERPSLLPERESHGDIADHVRVHSDRRVDGRERIAARVEHVGETHGG